MSPKQGFRHYPRDLAGWPLFGLTEEASERNLDLLQRATGILRRLKRRFHVDMQCLAKSDWPICMQP